MNELTQCELLNWFLVEQGGCRAAILPNHEISRIFIHPKRLLIRTSSARRHRLTSNFFRQGPAPGEHE